MRAVPNATTPTASVTFAAPAWLGCFKHQYMKNGMPANDDRVTDIILLGRAKMPGFQQKLTPQQLEASDGVSAYVVALSFRSQLSSLSPQENRERYVPTSLDYRATLGANG